MEISALPSPLRETPGFSGGVASFRSRLSRWYAQNARDLPWRRTRDPYAILVSEIMLQQTQVTTVIPYFERWMHRFPTFASLARASEADVLHAWQGLGYYSRARNLHRAAQAVVANHGGAMPRDLESIRALSGIGRYTAGAVATFAFDARTPIVEANIARVLARLFNQREPIDSARGQTLLWTHAAALLPQRHAGLHNAALMELGALVCIPRRPRCTECPVHGFCRAKQPELLPLKKPRRETVDLSEDCAWIVRGGFVLLEQQTGSRWRGLWKLPRLVISSDDSERGAPLVQLEYPFTHHRVRLSVFRAPPPDAPAPCQRWFARDSLHAMAMPAPHRRAMEACLSAGAVAERAP